jgi:hypothetical protein
MLAISALADPLLNPLTIPNVGSASLRLLSPTVLELSLVATKRPPPAPVTNWTFVGASGQFTAAASTAFQVTIDGEPVDVQTVGFRRRPLYAPFRERDLRIGNFLYLQLATAADQGQTVAVHNPGGNIWSYSAPQSVIADPLRWSPAIHVNQAGYMPGYAKVAMIGYYLGNLGELPVDAGVGFQLIDATSGQAVSSGSLSLRPDVGYNFTPTPYQQVLQADFTPFDVPGTYQLQVPGLGVSYPFRIDQGIAACFARTYALGIYHQRCGTSNALPFTRDVHGPCHTAMAEVPNMTFTAVNKELADFTADHTNNPLHTAPQLKDVNSSLYPFVNTNKVDVSGGHHDAGDYSKYTIDVAQLIHALVFAVDALPGVAGLDNLGLPESGDGISDLLQEAKWEADFLAKMQDSDGGFYFLVYPRNRAYEDNVLPDHGDPQVVFPKNTAATAAAVAALAQTASSPTFKNLYPYAAADYLTKALAGWNFLQQAIAKYGRNGAYQKISHYGDDFMHNDELAWAAAELFAATGDPSYQTELMTHYDPSDPNTRRFTWWRLFESYGCAVRSYAFAARTGRLQAAQLDPGYLAKCEAELIAGADDQVRFARESAYATSFPDPTKAFHTAGWYFSVQQAFDTVVGYQINPKPEYVDALIGNMNYEAGCNPLNLAFLTGIGWKRQREIVHQYAQNDRRVLPQSGFPIGNLQSAFPWDLPYYPNELEPLCYPSDSAATAPYAPYDIWGDTYNTSTEVVTAQQGRSLAILAWLMARTPLASQPWQSAIGQITFLSSSLPLGLTNKAQLSVTNVDLNQAQIVWEGRNQEPFMGATFNLSAPFLGPQWVEVEAMWPDGRRVFVASSFDSVAAHPVTAIGPDHVQIAGIVGQDFTLQRSVDLHNWTPILTDTFSSGAYDFFDPDAETLPLRFYRAVAAP